MTKITEREFTIRIENEKHTFDLSFIDGEFVIYAEDDMYGSSFVVLDKCGAVRVSDWLKGVLKK